MALVPDLSMMYKKRVAAKGWLSRTMNKAQELLDSDQPDQEALKVIQKELETRLNNLDGLQSDLELMIESESEMLDDIEKAGVFRDSVLCVLSKVVKADNLLSHVRALEALGVQGEAYGVMMVPVLLQRLPTAIRMEWARDGVGHEADLNWLLEFLDSEIGRRERSACLPL
ncbi:hypothetical protein FJT64_006345 [Amphibalanus amphitrite]|uniref:Uncharacterized protein n=1 Tax=Amphibalanus amphitrite TaxID=1232801 RepID=A0A6A4VNQ0_AMPAM|nr:hypothetical protein FJT64_006345 [Amphibalanus amphitrite]